MELDDKGDKVGDEGEEDRSSRDLKEESMKLSEEGILEIIMDSGGVEGSAQKFEYVYEFGERGGLSTGEFKGVELEDE